MSGKSPLTFAIHKFYYAFNVHNLCKRYRLDNISATQIIENHLISTTETWETLQTRYSNLSSRVYIWYYDPTHSSFPFTLIMFSTSTHTQLNHTPTINNSHSTHLYLLTIFILVKEKALRFLIKRFWFPLLLQLRRAFNHCFIPLHNPVHLAATHLNHFSSNNKWPANLITAERGLSDFSCKPSPLDLIQHAAILD